MERNNRVVGSVRAFLEGGTCYIGELIVHPERQNRGIGTRLLRATDEQLPATERKELFTGEKSERNLYLNGKHGYRVFKRKEVSDKLTLVILEKINRDA